MGKLVIILSLCAGFAAQAKLTDVDQTDKNKFDFYSLRGEVQKYQQGKASLEDIKQAVAELNKDGFKGLTPETLTAANAKDLQVVAEGTCGRIMIMGPAGVVTGINFPYSSAAGRAAAMASAQNACVAGFKPIDIVGGAGK